MIGTLLTLAGLAAPALGRMFDGERGEELGTKVAGVAHALTGKEDPDQAAAALQADPELLAEFNRQMVGLSVKTLEEDTKRLQAVNATMQQELHMGASVNNFWEFLLVLWKSGWRPAWGWVSCFAWGAFVVGVLWILAGAIEKGDLASLPATVNAIAAVIAAMMPIFAVAMAVLGVAVWKRSGDKKAAAGLAQAAGGFDLSGAAKAAKAIRARLGGDK